MNRPPRSKKVLVAIRADALPVVERTLGSEFDLVICHTLQAAQMQLNNEIGVIACGVHFDSGAMFDFLRFAKENPATRSIPFFLLIAETERYSKSILRGIQSAAELLGAAAFTDISRLKKSVGEEQAYERLRQSVQDCLLQHDPRS
jgi:hypothetical protein